MKTLLALLMCATPGALIDHRGTMPAGLINQPCSAVMTKIKDVEPTVSFRHHDFDQDVVLTYDEAVHGSWKVKKTVPKEGEEITVESIVDLYIQDPSGGGDVTDDDESGIPIWVWIVVGGVLILVVIWLVTRKK